MRIEKTALQTQNNIPLISKRGGVGYPFLNGEKSECPFLNGEKSECPFLNGKGAKQGRTEKIALQTQNNIPLVSKRGGVGCPFLNGEKSESLFLNGSGSKKTRGREGASTEKIALKTQSHVPLVWKRGVAVLAIFFILSSLLAQPIYTGSERTAHYFPLLEKKKLALVVNQTSVIGQSHLVDTLLKARFKIQVIFAPEHGFRGDADAGATIHNSKDDKTGIPVQSIYGSNKKPTKEQLKGIDLVIFDIQDVGARFYTYISTMHYVMEACAENNVEMLVLDRPNPHGAEVDGPVLDLKYKSFVGMHPIPVLHGLTVGELALMINGEKWLNNGLQCSLTVIPCEGWDHSMEWELQIPPSPNLPNDQAIMLYPSLCFFEGTDISIGRGTEFPFQVIGYPDPRFGMFSFTPQRSYGAADPLHRGMTCYGMDLRYVPYNPFTLKYLLYYSKMFAKPEQMITRASHFNLLAGNDILAKQIAQGLSESEIRASWTPELNVYKELRKKYLLYKDFE